MGPRHPTRGNRGASGCIPTLVEVPWRRRVRPIPSTLRGPLEPDAKRGRRSALTRRILSMHRGPPPPEREAWTFSSHSTPGRRGNLIGPAERPVSTRAVSLACRLSRWPAGCPVGLPAVPLACRPSRRPAGRLAEPCTPEGRRSPASPASPARPASPASPANQPAAQKSAGLDGALRTLAGHSYARWLLFLLATGLIVFAISGFAAARWAKTEPGPPA